LVRKRKGRSTRVVRTLLTLIEEFGKNLVYTVCGVSKGYPGCTDIRRAGQNRIYTPYMTVYLVTSLPKTLDIRACVCGSSQPFSFAYAPFCALPVCVQAKCLAFGPSLVHHIIVYNSVLAQHNTPCLELSFFAGTMMPRTNRPGMGVLLSMCCPLQTTFLQPDYEVRRSME